MADRVSCAVLRADVREVARGRRIAAAALREWGEEAAIPAVELLVSEMLGAAVRRAPGDVELRVRLDRGTVAVEVDEPSGEAAAPLWFAGDVASDWGRHEAPGRTVTWAQCAPRRLRDGAA